MVLIETGLLKNQKKMRNKKTLQAKTSLNFLSLSQVLVPATKTKLELSWITYQTVMFEKTKYDSLSKKHQ